SNDALDHGNVLLDRARLSGLGADITWGPARILFGVTSGVTSLSVIASSRANIYTVANTAFYPGSPVDLAMTWANDTINVEHTVGPLQLDLGGGQGADTVNITPIAQTLDNIQGAITVAGNGAPAQLWVFDTKTTANYDYVLPGTVVWRQTRYHGGPLISPPLHYTHLPHMP